jgi:tRNA nucleotidyltransferase/poly(A) polymerase
MRRICEDYLRILRYFRFHGRVSLTDDYDEDIINAIEHLKNGLRINIIITITIIMVIVIIQELFQGKNMERTSKNTNRPRNVNIMKCMFDCGVNGIFFSLYLLY